MPTSSLASGTPAPPRRHPTVLPVLALLALFAVGLIGPGEPVDASGGSVRAVALTPGFVRGQPPPVPPPGPAPETVCGLTDLVERPIWLLVPVAALAVMTCFAWMVERKNSLFIAYKARKRPFVREREVSPWRDPKFVFATVISILAAAGTITTAIVNLLIHI